MTGIKNARFCQTGGGRSSFKIFRTGECSLDWHRAMRICGLGRKLAVIPGQVVFLRRDWLRLGEKTCDKGAAQFRER